MTANYELTLTNGLVGGMTVQFAEGRWPDEAGFGVLMTDEAFDVVEPLLQSVATEWTSAHRYGVFELTPDVKRALIQKLQRQAENLLLQGGAEPKAKLLEQLAIWLASRLDEHQPVSVWGY